MQEPDRAVGAYADVVAGALQMWYLHRPEV